jgi:hypothetical protein
MMSIERRRRKRLACDIGAQIIHRGRSMGAQIRNLTAEGACVHTHTLSVPRGTLIRLNIEIDHLDRQISGLVVRQHTGGLGLVFSRPQPEIYNLVLSRPRQNAPLPVDALNREFA